MTQAKNYDKLIEKYKKELGIVILLDIKKEEAKKRILGRVSCPNCGAVYNLYSVNIRPRIAGICDRCGTELVRREDDNEETFDIRFSTYMNETKPVVNYYNQLGILKKVDSSMPLSEVLSQIERIIKEQ